MTNCAAGNSGGRSVRLPCPLAKDGSPERCGSSSVIAAGSAQTVSLGVELSLGERQRTVLLYPAEAPGEAAGGQTRARLRQPHLPRLLNSPNIVSTTYKVDTSMNVTKPRRTRRPYTEKFKRTLIEARNEALASVAGMPPANGVMPLLYRMRDGH